MCVYIYMYVCIYIAMLHDMQDLSSPTRDQTHTACSGSTESQPLDHQENPQVNFNNVFYITQHS